MVNGEILVQSGDKFALLAIRCRTIDLPPCLKLAPWVFATTRPPFEFGGLWTNLLGTIRSENFRNANLFLLAIVQPENSRILDDINEALRDTLWRLLVGLLLSERTSFEKPDSLLGAHDGSGLIIRQINEYQQSTIISGIGQYLIDTDILRKSWTIAQKIYEWNQRGAAWRINNVLMNFVDARAHIRIPDRIHQFCRCIEGFILPDAGNTKKQFKSRTELFIGPRNHDLIGKIYDVRSEVEHLHYQKLIEPAGRCERLKLARYAAIVEAIARGCFTRILLNRNLWPHFQTDAALEKFWGLCDAERRSLWGSFTPISDLINGFREDCITNEDLGLPGHR